MVTKIWPVVYHAMPDRERLGLLAVCEKRYDACDCAPLAREIRRFRNQGLVACVFRREFSLMVADRFDLARENRLRDERLNPEKSELNASGNHSATRLRPAVQPKTTVVLRLCIGRS